MRMPPQGTKLPFHPVTLAGAITMATVGCNAIKTQPTKSITPRFESIKQSTLEALQPTVAIVVMVTGPSGTSSDDVAAPGGLFANWRAP